MTSLALDRIVADERCQPRTTFDTQLVEQYAEAMANGDTFPPVKVFFDGVDHFLADGFHRYHAANGLGLVEIDADVSEGSLRDAILYSCSANANHGWRRTNDDKRRAVLRLLNDPEWSRWSDSDIRKHCKVSLDMVQRHRASLTYRPVSDIPAPPAPSVPQAVREKAEQIEAEGGVPRFFTNRHGGVSVMRTANIGAKPASVPAQSTDDDKPVFDATPTGQSWRDHTTPERQADLDAVRRETWTANVRDVVNLVKALPDPVSAAKRFPNLLLHSVNPADIDAAAQWLAAFSIEISKRKEPANVAA